VIVRRLVSGAVAAGALAGMPLLTGGIAAATESSPAPRVDAAPTCNAGAEGAATGSPGVNSSNVNQAPTNICPAVTVLDF